MLLACPSRRSLSVERMERALRQGDVLLGKYLVESVLGEGGMGMVVAARNVHLDERVALKFLLAEGAAEPMARQRFLREARAAAQIKGEHVVKVTDVNVLKDGTPFIVMEYLAGCESRSVASGKGPARCANVHHVRVASLRSTGAGARARHCPS